MAAVLKKYMLSKNQRYPLRQDPSFFQTAQRTQCFPFLVYFKKFPDVKTPSQGAVIVAKKNVPKSTQRNKLKRQVKALLSPTLSMMPGFVIVVLVQKDFEKNSVEDLKKCFQKIMA